MNPILDDLRSRLPRVLNRKQVGEYLGEFISPKSLANLDSQGCGPTCYRIGKRKVFYYSSDLVDWLEIRSSRRK